MSHVLSGHLTRRSMLKFTAVLAAAPLVVPARVLGQDSPSNMLRIGCIGVGRMGTGDMRECIHRGLNLNARVVAVCDVDNHRAEAARQLVDATYAKELKSETYEGCKAYADYRELLARPDIDGVLITTPEHWHALCGIHAAQAGKDMYIEKPVTYSVAEGRALVKAVREHGRVLQVGSQQRSSIRFRMACELVRNGRLGKLLAIEAQMPIDRGRGNADPMPVPSNLNYDMWMGPTAEMPYTEHRVHPQSGHGRPGWLQIEQYCRGMITGWGSHMNDIAQWGNGSDDTGPVEIEAMAEFPERGLFDVHTRYLSVARYANGVTLIQRTGDAGVRFIGERGHIWVTRNTIQANPQEILRERVRDDELRLYESNNHMTNFLECMRSRKDPVAAVEIGHRSNSICVITHIAMKLGRKLQWDPEAEAFVNDDAANAMLGYEYRKPWALG